jgi:hypothetical protein
MDQHHHYVRFHSFSINAKTAPQLIAGHIRRHVVPECESYATFFHGYFLICTNFDNRQRQKQQQQPSHMCTGQAASATSQHAGPQVHYIPIFHFDFSIHNVFSVQI